MQLGCTSCLAKLFLKLLHGTVVQKLRSELFLKRLFGTVAQTLSCEAISQGRMSISIPGRCSVFLSNGRGLGRSLSYVCWAQSNQSVRDAACSSPAQVALRSYFLSFCMELSCQSCLAELFLKLSHGTVVQNLLCEAIF